jgi:hypothetical protein
MQPPLKVIANCTTMDRIFEDGFQALLNGIAIRRQKIAQPVKRLHQAHGRPTRPIQAAGGGKLEGDRHVTKLDWTDSSTRYLVSIPNPKPSVSSARFGRAESLSRRA